MQGADTLFAQIVGDAYPVCDLILVFCLLVLSAHSDDPALRRALPLLALALGIIVATDSIFDYQTLHNAYHTGELVDAGWPLGYMLLGLAVQHLRRATAIPRTPLEPLAMRSPAAPGAVPQVWRALLPYAFVPAVGVLSLYAWHGHGSAPLDLGVYVGGAVLIALVVLRQVFALLENRRLYASLSAAYNRLEHRAQQAQQLNHELRAAQEEVRTVHGAMACGVVVVNAAGDIVDANAAAEEILGRSLAEMQGGMDAVAWGAAHADGTTLAEAEHPLLLALRTGCPQREPVVRITRPGGELRWLQVDAVPVPGPDGTPERVVVSFIDISERVQAEGALRASEERFRSVTESAHDAIIAADGQGTILSWNAGARAIFGYRADEVIGQPLTIVMPERYHAAHRRALERLTDTGILQLSGQAVEMQGRRKDGSEFPLELSLSTWATAEGRFYSGIIRDITDRKQAEEAERARMAAEQASAQKSEFLSRMSHELRTPLNAILGFAQLLELDARDPEQEQSVAQILRAGRHLLGLINEVLDITRIEAGRMELSLEPTRLGDVVRKAHALVLPLAQERGVRWDLGGLADCDCHVRADRQRLAQVLLNLLSNAVKYNWEGGTVALSCAMPTPDRLRLVVRDTGMGIAEHRLGRLFTPFERLGAEASGVEGTGMGLALSRSLVAAMGGVIGVESVEGQGSAFWIELERTEAPAAPAPHTAIGPLALRPAEARRTVLYIEDNLSNLQLTERLFAAQPQVALLSAMQGQRGLELARAHVPDLILLDVHLPDMRGDEVLRRLRDDPATRNIPVVVLSADATQRQKDRLADAGAQDYLTKPLDIAQFRRTVDTLLQQEVS